MKLGSFFENDRSRSFYGIVEGNSVIEINNYYYKIKKKEYSLNKLNISTPVYPTKIVAVGLNYKSHADEMKDNLPEEPLIFLKPSSSIIANKDNIHYPEGVKRLDYEAELGIVIKKEAKNVGLSDCQDFILGYTCFNDVTARDLQSKDGQWTRAKSFDSFAPFGPFIETEIKNPQNLRIQSILNGEVKQDSNTSNMIFSIFYLLSFISGIMTLYPGDIIATGTPQGIGAMQRGDEIIIRIEGLDDLMNYIK